MRCTPGGEVWDENRRRDSAVRFTGRVAKFGLGQLPSSACCRRRERYRGSGRNACWAEVGDGVPVGAEIGAVEGVGTFVAFDDGTGGRPERSAPEEDGKGSHREVGLLAGRPGSATGSDTTQIPIDLFEWDHVCADAGARTPLIDRVCIVHENLQSRLPRWLSVDLLEVQGDLQGAR